MSVLEMISFNYLAIFANFWGIVWSLPTGSIISDNIPYEEVICIISLGSILLALVGCLNWRDWKICKRFKFNQLESHHTSDQTINFPDSFNPDCSVAFDLLPDIQVSIPGSPIDLLEKYFFPKIYTEKNLTNVDVEKEVEILMKTLKNKHHIERLNVETSKEIGKGWFGPVMNGCIKDGIRTSKCVISALNELAAPSQVLNYFKETAAYREIKHTNVLRLMFTNIDTIPFWTILEFCHLGDLKSYLVAHRVAHESINQKGLLTKFAVDMAYGLSALHDHKYIHRDFATRNCMVSSDLTIKVGDYGIAIEKFRGDYFEWEGFFIPLRWMPPEAFHFTEGTFKLRKMTKVTNVWSFGVVIWELISFGMLPFPDFSNEELLNQPKDGNWKRFFVADHLHKNSQKLSKVMDICLMNAHRRSTMQTVISHLTSLKIDLNSDHLCTSLMRDTLSNSGSPCEFVDAEDAFVSESIINENFNFDSIALSFELASDDDFDVGFNARSSSSVDLKKGSQGMSQLDEGLVKSLSFDECINSTVDEKFHESVKTYYEDMLKKHKNVLDTSPVYFDLSDEADSDVSKCENQPFKNDVSESRLEQSNENCSGGITEFLISEAGKTTIIISPSDIHQFNDDDDDDLSLENYGNSGCGSVVSLASNSASKIVNIDENSLNNKDLLSALQPVIKSFDVDEVTANDEKGGNPETIQNVIHGKIKDELVFEHHELAENHGNSHEKTEESAKLSTFNGHLSEAPQVHSKAKENNSPFKIDLLSNQIDMNSPSVLFGFEDNFTPS